MSLRVARMVEQDEVRIETKHNEAIPRTHQTGDCFSKTRNDIDEIKEN